MHYLGIRKNILLFEGLQHSQVFEAYQIAEIDPLYNNSQFYLSSPRKHGNLFEDNLTVQQNICVEQTCRNRLLIFYMCFDFCFITLNRLNET